MQIVVYFSKLYRLREKILVFTKHSEKINNSQASVQKVFLKTFVRILSNYEDKVCKGSIILLA